LTLLGILLQYHRFGYSVSVGKEEGGQEDRELSRFSRNPREEEQCPF